MILIPLDNITPRFTQTVDLDGETFTFAFEWNDRNAQWSFSLSNNDGAPLASGISIVVGVPLLNRVKTLPGLPAGMLEAIDTSDLSLDPGFDDLGDRVQLAYTPANEISSDFKV